MKGLLLAMFFAASFHAQTGADCDAVVGHVDDAKGNGHIVSATWGDVDPDYNYIRYHDSSKGTEVVSVFVWDENGEDVADRYDVASWR